jgi:hypothetical protein
VFVRDDAGNGWVQNVLAYEEPITPATTVRSIGFHRDRVTGADMVFLGTAGEGPADDPAMFVAQHPEVPVSSVPDQSWSRRGAGTVHWAKQGFYLERCCENGAVTYAIREVHDATRTTPDWLARVRSVCESPFAEEKGKAVYAGGFGAWGLRVSNTGWIYRGEFQTPTPQGN